MSESIFTNLPTIQTARLTLRPFTVDDAQDVFEYASHPEVPKFLPWEPHKTIQDSRDFIETVLRAYRDGAPSGWAMVLNENSKVVGSCGYNRLDKDNLTGEIGYALGFSHWGKGLMTEAVSALIDFGFDQLELNRISAIAEVENTGSWRVMEKAGMTYEGTLREIRLLGGKFQSFKVYAVLRRERP